MSERERLAAGLRAERDRRIAAGLERELQMPSGGIDFTSNDYLGLARDERLVQAARDALTNHGVGGRASRLLGGGSSLDVELERDVAAWLGAEAALAFPSGYHANLGVVGALVGPGDVVLSDALDHASLIDAVRLSRARVIVYRHADAADLEARLANLRGARRVLVLTESVFGMDGDLAPLGAIADVCARHSASLIVDEAHAIGVVGPEGAGGWAALGHERARDPVLAARIVTGGKALGVQGGLVVCAQDVRRQVLNRARTFAFTTASSPVLSGALKAAVALARNARAERERAHGLARRLATALELPTPSACIVPVHVGDNRTAVEHASRLQQAGFDVRAVRPPTVPAGTARLRVVCHASNDEHQVERLAQLLHELPRGDAKPATASPRAEALVVSGTDTDVGKTVVSALLLRAAARLGTATYWKPVQTGDDCDTTSVRGLAQDCGARFQEPTQHFPLPASPHEAAREAGSAVELERLDADLTAHRAAAGGWLVVEPAGGLLVPLTMQTSQLDWLARQRLPCVLVARSGLGTLNHTLLSFEALRARHLTPRALVLVGPHHESNRETLRALTGVAGLYEVPIFDPLDAAALDAWIDGHDLSPVFERGAPA